MRDVLRTPGVAGLFLASCVARLPMGALGLLIVLHTRELTGSYAASGAAVAAYTAGMAIASPVLGRVVDRRGQTLVLRAASLVAAVAMVAIALLPADASLLSIALPAAVAGAAQPPIGACMRALWPELLDADRRTAAYAMESIALEVVYICGPVLIVGAIGSWSLRGAIVACAVLLLAGNLAFTARAESRTWRPHEDRADALAGALRAGGVRVLIGTFLLAGLAIGAVEVAVPAGLEDEGAKGAVGFVLAAWGAGSILGGLTAARLRPPRDPARRLGLLVLAWTAAHAAVALARSPWAFAALLLIAGATIAPTFVTANGMMDGLVLPGTLTEAFTWTTTGMTIGIALGSALAGQLVAALSPASALAVPGALAAVGVVVLFAAAREVLRRPPVTA